MFYRVKNNALLDFADTKYLDECLYTDIVTQEQLAKDVSQVMVVDNELVLNPNYEAEQEAKRQQEIAMLSLTSADVEREIYKATGKDFDDVMALVEQLSTTIINEETGEVIQQGIDIDVKALKIELKANNFYRGNPYVDAVGSLLGFTKEQLDEFFADGNYKHLLHVVEEEPTEVIDS